MKLLAYTHASRIGPFVIAPSPDGWQILWESQCLGDQYTEPQQALDDLVGGHSDWAGVTDPSTLGLAEEISDWDATSVNR